MSSTSHRKQLTNFVNNIGAFDTIIHNVSVGYSEEFRKKEDGIAHVFSVNALAPYEFNGKAKELDLHEFRTA